MHSRTRAAPSPLRSLALSLLAALAGTACGGSSGPGALTVTATSPASNATGVPLDAVITVDFNVALDPATVSANVEVKDLGTGTIAGTRASSGSRLTFTPGAPLRANAQYTVSLWGSLRGAGGEQLSGSYAFSFTTAAPVTFTVGGTVSGLAAGKSVVLQNNNADDLTVAANGAFTFATRLATAANYHVSVATQPANQACVVAQGNGAVSGANVTDVTVTCSTTGYTVGGTVSGLATGKSVTLRNNGADPLTVSANGAFTFPTSLANNAAYAVTVATHPAQGSCTVANGAGNVSGANVTNVAVTCATDTTAPTVASRTPASSATGVAVNAPITVVFSEPMIEASLTTGYAACTSGFRLTTTASTGVCVPGTFAFTGATLTFTPASPLANGTFYTVFVTNAATDLAGNPIAAASSWGFSTIEAIPSAPTGVTATKGNAQVTVAWTASSGAASYNVYWSTSPGVSTLSTKVASVTSGWVHTSLTNGAAYYYRVSAVNTGGESALSSEASATPQVPAPAAPAGLAAAPGNAQVTLTWTASSGAASYNLYWKTSAGVTTSTSSGVPGVASGYVHTGCANGTTCYYRVSAVNAGGESPLSNEASATPQVPAPPAPANLVATKGNGQVTLTWGTPNYATSFNLYWATAAGVTASSTKIGPVSSGYVHSSLANGTTYYYRVSGVSAGGEGPLSTEASATPQIPAPGAPTLSNLVVGPGQGQLTASWTTVSGATSYNLYWTTGLGVTTSSTQVLGVTSPYVLGSLAAGTTYSVRVAAVNAGGESPLSNELYKQTLVGAPTGLVITSADPNTVNLAWNVLQSATGYYVHWKLGSSVSSSDSAFYVAGGSTTTRSMTGLAPNTAYSFAVQGVGSSGPGGLLSNEVGTTTPPAGVTGLYAYGDDGAVQLGWQPTAGASSTIVYWSAGAGVSTSSVSTTVAAPATSFNHGSRANGTTYCYRLVAVNSFGWSSPFPSTDTCAVPDVKATVRDWRPTLRGTAKGSSAYVGLGFYGGLFRSTDGGATWTAVNGRWGGTFVGIAYGAGKFVVLTNGGPILSSIDDGATWTSSSSPLQLGGVVFGGGAFVATGSAGVYRSTDGVAWSLVAPGVGGALAYDAAGTMFVAAAATVVATSSPDGSSWTSKSFGAGSMLDMAAQGGKIVVTAPASSGFPGMTYWASADRGATFTSTVSSTFDGKSFEAVALAGGAGLFVGVGTASYPRQFGRVYSSTDGLNWTAQNCTSTQEFAYVNFNGSAFMATGTALSVVNSANGTTWNVVSGGVDLTAYYAAGSSSSTVAVVGTSGAIRTSTNGSTWTARTASGVTSNFRDIAWGHASSTDIFVAVTDSNDIAVSVDDGLTWTRRTLAQSFKAVSYRPDTSRFLATEGSKLYYSSDTITWNSLTPTLTPSSTATAFTGVAGGNGYMVLLGNYTGNPSKALAVAIDDNTATWSEAALASASNYSYIATLEAVFGNNAFLFNTYDYGTYRSTAPPAATGVGGSVGRIRFTGGKFMRGALWTSPDGTAPWTQRNPGVIKHTDTACTTTFCAFIGIDGLIATVGAVY